MAKSAVLGFPRIGPNRELKKSTESYWKGKITQDELVAVGKQIRKDNWLLQKQSGIDIIPSNDFSFYDHILDISVLFNVIPKRYSDLKLSTLDTVFAMGRGLQRDEIDVTALEMVKWFDSNYHYVRPTFSHDTQFKLVGSKPIDEFLEAKELGVITRPVLLGPVSLLFLGKPDNDSLDLDLLSLLPKLLPVYVELLTQLKKAGAEQVQIDEPILVLDLDSKVKAAYSTFFKALEAASTTIPSITLSTYFGTVVPNLEVLKSAPVETLHFDFIRAPEQINDVLTVISANQKLSIGIVDGRNIWKNDFETSIEFINNVIQKIPTERIVIATSSSLLHTPVDLNNETKLSDEVKDFFSFATQKLNEVTILTNLINNPKDVDAIKQLEVNIKSITAKKNSKITTNETVQKRLKSIDDKMATRASPFVERLKEQQKVFNLPLFPTTTIGSFPQTKDIRINRNKFVKGTITKEEYETFINEEIERVIRFQEEIGLDVLVHGEPERNDMVQYFGEQIDGYYFTQNGWVQSYGSRYVRPPIIVGDLSRPNPMSVRESVYAQSITKKTVKGMLTGPITCLRWSFPRVDINQESQALQLALVLRDEVQDLEKAGIKCIQVDEPALREGLPLREGKERSEYLDWAAKAFRVATSGVTNATQIHSHFCYSDLDPTHIKALDADVVSIEFSKKDDPKYIKEFQTYPNHIGLGLFDIHSPRVPSKEEFIAKIDKILESYPAEKFWVNPDCGLKTRDWDETRVSLTNMVEAAKYFREEYESKN
ncbi:hypothetical protein TBLA_0I00500 [Henningerozyma blattae CBS 6284]|uniref:5-methyltetrahydropteroyltriglutamate--homocysteine S-methyltransferase n=1 Tax=Henningerozyma blattae (strain ATCC 34711 / CBS 6284 / DSM 70876 / NBRC 10599 / NRRL Y-10934 / UCD 77-7) TaxID=1071380 RepID=I2H8K9_HENB6|nr:hypothetical protein TBLA_0I00500 [Tetrapisispora blattae CBS 6284]CCH62711.1 hypothetical protein TBLA_0I00500 [Tetrapisispora blattae CBS 6284]